MVVVSPHLADVRGPPPRSPRRSCARGIAPAMHAAHSSTLRLVRSFSARPLTMSAIASRPPGPQDARGLGEDPALERREVDRRRSR